ncbi:hypothetical protein [Halorubrum sp. BV1]|uniref:hypothetical protein n=1 Tax=Halorubrum sp. BV1 TaxID=1498500 RepID=UPI0012BB16FA|nr:hypothetical protein [Halorubrum sp. BV1]
MAVAQVKGTPFCRKTTVNGREEWRTYISTHIYGAVSADGEYTVWREKAPVQLSKQDYEKWNYEQGDTLVLLGGQSTSSRIIELDSPTEREVIVGSLLSDSKWFNEGIDGRKEALDWLRHYGYEVGSAGKNGPRREYSTNNPHPEPSGAYRLQQRAERNDVEALGHHERLDVANRLLRTRGWDGADEWFQEQ